MCVVAVLNGAEYEFVHHAPELLAAGGSDAQVQALRRPEHAATDATLFDEITRDAIRLTVSLTRDVSADDELMKRLRDQLGDRELFELVTTIAAYNMVSRMIVALQIEPENH
jgi:alkylhydroperoxidase family enzyme